MERGSPLFYPISTKEYKKILEAFFKGELIFPVSGGMVNNAMVVVGPAGIGKTQIAKQMALEMGHVVLEVYLSMREPIDLIGCPLPQDLKGDDGVRRVTIRTIPELIYLTNDLKEKTGKNVLVLFDEFANAERNTLKALYQILLEQRIEDLSFPKGTKILLLGNEDYEGVGWVIEEFPFAFLDRLMRYRLGVNVDDWIKWALNEGDIHPAVIGFIKYKPEFLHVMDMKKGLLATPRAWQRVSCILKEFSYAGDDSLVVPLVGGVIGSGLAGTFFNWMKVIQGIDMLEVIKKCDLREIIGNVEREFALISSLASLLNKDNGKEYFEYAGKIAYAIYEAGKKGMTDRSQEMLIFLFFSAKKFTSWFFISKVKPEFKEYAKQIIDALGGINLKYEEELKKVQKDKE